MAEPDEWLHKTLEEVRDLAKSTAQTVNEVLVPNLKGLDEWRTKTDAEIHLAKGAMRATRNLFGVLVTLLGLAVTAAGVIVAVVANGGA